MRRRDFIKAAIIGSAVVRPRTARAQQPTSIKRVGIVVAYADGDPEIKPRILAFRQELDRLGWSESHNLRIDLRYAPPSTPLQALTQDLISSQPDIIFAHGTPVTAALQSQTHTIPIVFVNVSDPVGSGFVESLARPGGNLTGVLLYEQSIVGKWLGLLKEITPHLVRVALLANPKTSAYDYFVRGAEAIAPSLAIRLALNKVETRDDISHSIESFAHFPDGGLLLIPDFTTSNHRDLIITLAAQYRIPAVYSFRFFVTAGGLMSYGTDLIDVFRQGAAYIDRILRGDEPRNLPVEAPTKYETTVNLKTAKALGLEVPPSLLVRADEVIE
jgi:putative tryptophan/tyrosine transport system substrate-binding protein